MNTSPTLVVMAAGMGSRYGGLKQAEPVSEGGQWILDYSAYDAMRAGFKRVIFVVKRENEELFRKLAGERISRYIDTDYCFQDLTDLPEGFSVPEKREKPWGTAQAVWACREVIDEPFAVCNADDFYGRGTFEAVYGFLSGKTCTVGRHALIGFLLKNTLTEHGTVSRGVCAVENGLLTGLDERLRIKKTETGGAFTEDDGKTWTHLSGDSVVSMNMWGFHQSLISDLETVFADTLSNMENPLKDEVYLPIAIDGLRREGKAAVEVLASNERWYGVTYREDRPELLEALKQKREAGEYPF